MIDTLEGDLIRPLGHLTLYFAYAEGELDELLGVLSVCEPFRDAERQWPVGRKLDQARRIVQSLESNELAPLSAALEDARQLFDRRNVIVHSQLYAGGRLVSNRRGAPKCVTPNELTELAELIFACKERISASRQKCVVPLLVRLGYRIDG